MKISNLLAAPLRYRPWQPRHLRLILDDMRRPARQPEHDNRAHLQGAIYWLCRAQDVRAGLPDEGGVSAGWSFEDGWLPSYPETTGYIIETFLEAARLLQQPELERRARRMLDWELTLQRADGAFPGHFGDASRPPVIFNTGQIMHGLTAGYLQLGRRECLEAAVRAGWWLSRQQDSDGCFRRFEHNGVPHVYNTRAVWALAAVGVLCDEPKFLDAARRNLDWALTQQTASGWFAANAFIPGQSPFTHTIAYAIRGLLECGVLLAQQHYIDAAICAARGLAHAQRADGWLAGTYEDGWLPSADYACVTGVAQMSLNWGRLAQATGDGYWCLPARRALAYVKRTQRLDDPDDVVRGAIPGSASIWGDYSRFEFPNWAPKFFADALMIEMQQAAMPPVVALSREAVI